MSAYERAWDAFRGVVSDVELDRLLKDVEQEHAHELAEQIRAKLETLAPECCDAHCSAQAAADLIDPESQLERRLCGMEQAHTDHRWIQNGVWYLCSTVVLNSGG